jgi:hypothetical protein
MHTDMFVAPSAIEYLPFGQSSHALKPLDDANLPGEQAVQEVALVSDIANPTGQGQQSVLRLPVPKYLPEAHGMHVVDPENALKRTS